MLPSRAKALIAVAGASALMFGGVLPASAGPGAASHNGRAAQSSRLVTVTSNLTGPRGLAVVNKHKSFVGQADGTISRVVKRAGMPATVTTVTHVPGTFIAPAVALGRHHTLWILTAASDPGTGGATLYKWRSGFTAPKVVADIAAYQTTDHDPYDLEDNPSDSDPYGVVALKHGVLVADAAGNDLLRVSGSGHVRTVAVLKPRTVITPNGLPGVDPESGDPLPPAGTPLPAEAVATSVTVGSDGFWYVGELRGFPATPGTSEIWRIKPGSHNAVCDPEHPQAGHCKRYLDGLTSIVDLAPAPNGRLYALELSKMSWLQMELGAPGSTEGGLFKVRAHHVIRELAKGKLIQPGDVDRVGRVLEVTGPVFGPGNLFRIR
ncbi:hypothetical protein ACVW00_001035 [Marmoricola sp. URHA0025 HA25]